MTHRPTQETAACLRATLQRLDDTHDPAKAPGDLADLKQILLNRISILEAKEAVASVDPQSKDGLAKEST